MLNRSGRFGALFIASICLCSCAGAINTAAPDLVAAENIKTASINYKLVSPEITGFIITGSSYGSAVFPQKEKLSVKNAGYLDNINVKISTFVNKGDILAEVSYDQDWVQTNIQLTNLSIDKENANYAAGEKDYAGNLKALKARMNEETDEPSRQTDALRIEQMGRSRQQAADAHKAALESLDKDLADYQAMTEPEQLTAPYDGFIDYTAGMSPEDPVAAGLTLVEICDTSVYQLVFTGGQNDFYFNMPVKITIRDDARTEMDGVIVSDSTAVDSYGKCSYVVQTPDKIPNLKNAVRINSSGGFDVTGDCMAIGGAMMIPLSAVQNDQGKSYVNIYDNGIVKKRYVKLGAQSTNSVQILDGLSVNDKVIN